MSYKALYRTYRPNNFKEVKGQEHIVTTLKNIISGNKVSHAYLFAGPRGTGKTSVAKVFAKILNCHFPIDQFSPCNKCASCLALNKNASLDILEIDAASNNGVAEIREIRNNINYAPSNSKYKIYIVDEVHMLSKGAFNALLKTLEEPPAHAIFILATTEAHKIPITILSRTQRFNFRRVSEQVILKVLEDVAAKESFRYEDSALKLIAKLSKGGLRDALSIMDQAAAYSNEEITFESISQIFGVISVSNQILILNYAFKNDVTNLLLLVNKFIENGIDLQRVTESLIDIIKDYIIFVKTNNEKFLSQVSVEELAQLEINLVFAYDSLDLLVKLLTELSYSEVPKQSFELAMLHLSKENIESHTQELIIKNIKNSSDTITQEINSFEEVVVIPEEAQKLIVPDVQENSQETNEPQESSVNDLQEDDHEAIDLFSTQELNAVNELGDPSIDTQEINNATQSIADELDDEFENQTIEDSILSTQEIEIPQASVEKKTVTMGINLEQDETEDLLSLFESPEEKEATPESSTVLAPEFPLSELINLLIQKDDAEHALTKEKWSNIISFASHHVYGNDANLLDSAKLITTGKNFILLSSLSQDVCDSLNKVRKDNNFLKLLKEIFGKEKLIFAISKDLFEELKNEYITLSKNNKLPSIKLIESVSIQEVENNEAKKLGTDIFGDLFN